MACCIRKNWIVGNVTMTPPSPSCGPSKKKRTSALISSVIHPSSVQIGMRPPSRVHCIQGRRCWTVANGVPQSMPQKSLGSFHVLGGAAVHDRRKTRRITSMYRIATSMHPPPSRAEGLPLLILDNFPSVDQKHGLVRLFLVQRDNHKVSWVAGADMHLEIGIVRLFSASVSTWLFCRIVFDIPYFHSL